MTKIAENVLDLIGGTPLVKLKRLSYDCRATVIAKLEYLNPAGSLKDRIAKSMIEAAERDRELRSGQSIVAAVRSDKQSIKPGNILEPTGGNTGVSLACVAAAKGYKLTLTMPDTVSAERQNLLKAYGAELILTDGNLGMSGAIDKAEELRNGDTEYFVPQQFKNPANPKAHRSTAEEIWKDTDGRVDVVVCGIGTGGTLMGIAEVLKKCKPEIKMVAVEPSESAVISGGKPSSHGIAGLGAGFIPPILNLDLIDEIVTVTSDEAVDFTRRLAREEGILAGLSSGAVVCGGLRLAKRDENNGRMIVVVLPDSGERYLDNPAYNDG